MGGNDKAQETDQGIEDLKCKARVALLKSVEEKGALIFEGASTPTESSPEELDSIKRKAVTSLAALASDQEASEGFLASSTSVQAANRAVHDEDLESIKRRLAASLEICSRTGSLESMLQETMKATSKRKDSEHSTSPNLNIIRQKAVSVLEKAASCGLLEKAVMSSMSDAGNPDKSLTPLRKKGEDNAVRDIRERAASCFLKAGQSGSLGQALSAVAKREENRDRIRGYLEEAVRNGSLESVVTNACNQKTQYVEKQDDVELEKIRQKAQASLEAFLRTEGSFA